jgi:hypothetical protein
MSSLYDFLNTELSSSATGGVNTAEGQDPSTVNDGLRQFKQLVAAFIDDLGAVTTVGGTADAITVTLGQVGGANSISAYATGQLFRFKAGADNTGAATINVNAIGAKAIRKIESGADVALDAADILDGKYYLAIYDATANAAAGAWIIDPGSASVAAATTTAAGIVEQQFNAIYNIGFTASVAASALTVALKDAEGNDPSASSPVIIPFRNVTAATGTPSYLTITAATSIVISSGSTMGFASGVAGRLWIVGFNDGGTFRLGLVNARSGITLMTLRDGIYSSTAEGGAGGADTAQVIYTGTAVTSKAMVILGYLEATEATAGTWATAPSLLKLRMPGDPLPGDTVQIRRNDTGAVATGTTIMPYDDTIPQNTEGDQYMSQAITPTAATNLLRVQSSAVSVSNSSGGVLAVALFQDTTADALAVNSAAPNAATAWNPMTIDYSMLAGTASSTTFKIRAGNSAAGTTSFNGQSSARKFGGVYNSFLQATEIMA